MEVTAETAYDGLELPEWEREERPCFSVADDCPNYRTVAGTVQDGLATGRGDRNSTRRNMRFNVGDVDVNQRIIVVQRSRTKDANSKPQRREGETAW